MIALWLHYIHEYWLLIIFVVAIGASVFILTDATLGKPCRKYTQYEKGVIFVKKKLGEGVLPEHLWLSVPVDTPMTDFQRGMFAELKKENKQ